MDQLSLWSACGAGILAGLGAVVPLGAIGVMQLHEGAKRGWRASIPAASGVAVADTIYCLLAVVAGSIVAPVVSSWGEWPALVGGALLFVVAVLMLRSAVRGPHGLPARRHRRAGHGSLCSSR